MWARTGRGESQKPSRKAMADVVGGTVEDRGSP